MKDSVQLLFGFMLLGVSACRVVPIQMARISLSERYNQSFFDKPGTTFSYEEITGTLGGLLGQKNLTALRRTHNQEIVQLQNKQCEAQGAVDIKLSLEPGSIRSKDDFRFFVSGNGNYVILLKTTRQVFYTATFQLIEASHSASELFNGEVRARFRQQLIGAYPGNQENYASESEVEARLRIKKYGAGQFGIDYGAQHEIWLFSDARQTFIGYLKFVPPVSEKAKIIDLRGLRFVRNEY